MLFRSFNFTLLQKKELNVFGSRNALKKDFVELIDLVKEGNTPVERIITNMYRFEDGAMAFHDFANNPGNMLKVILDFTKNQGVFNGCFPLAVRSGVRWYPARRGGKK